MIISHRGNINGRFESYENEPNYIDKAISDGYDVEIDVWFSNDNLFLGHDNPQYGVNFEWLADRITKLWIHCKNVEAINYFQECRLDFNYFWHETDTVTLTSKRYVWAYPGKQPIRNSIAVMPEINDDDVSFCIGVCTDYPEKYKQIKESII
jgi:hypothetical protein